MSREDKKKKRQQAENTPEAQEVQETQEEQQPEEQTPEAGEAAPEADGELGQLKAEKDALSQEKDALNDKLMRIAAEYDNFRKRSQREKDMIYPEAVAGTTAKFLPLIDNFERALACETQDAEFRKGVEMIFTAFQNVLKGLNVEEFGKAGDPFNPEMHNAVMHEESDEYEEGIITEVFQKGYRIGDRIIRFAMVKVVN